MHIVTQARCQASAAAKQTSFPTAVGIARHELAIACAVAEQALIQTSGGVAQTGPLPPLPGGNDMFEYAVLDPPVKMLP